MAFGMAPAVPAMARFSPSLCSLSRYYGNSNAYNSNYYSQSRMLHDASNFMGDFDLLGLVTKGVEIYKKLNEEEE